ncbi:MAG: sigma-54-dependent Fis family transcriptional regulator [Deltaproteobacteria bacterium]|nr:sigma-54-dependent Fis family transcriptional regulator [Deltaproteobacteria bacterium]
MTKRRILFVEDDASGREIGTYNLREAGYEVDAAETGEQGLERFSPGVHDLVITDLRMPGIGGMDVLRAVKQRAPETPVLVITAYGSVDTAVEAMKAGAQDFIGKPFNRDHLLLTVERALERWRLRDEVRSLRSQAAGVERPIIAASAPLRRVLDMADRVAPTDASALITGETGTGKELVARRIHARSRRSALPFVPVNCAAVPAELIESELFGHERGAFTGAQKARQGRFRQAHRGTIFLDEIAELAAPLQSKLLRVLQEGVVDVVGSDTPVTVDVRVIAATNRDLAERIAQGQFREDLFYRLNVVEIPVPPLRERPEEIEPLVGHFIQAFAPGRELSVPEKLLDELRARPWPGNVRQLQNACERLVILCPGDELRAEDLPPAEPQPAAPEGEVPGSLDWPPLPDDGLGLVDLEKRVIERVLELKEGNVTQAAAYLRVPRHILAYRMVKYGLRRPS